MEQRFKSITLSTKKTMCISSLSREENAKLSQEIIDFISKDREMNEELANTIDLLKVIRHVDTYFNPNYNGIPSYRVQGYVYLRDITYIPKSFVENSEITITEHYDGGIIHPDILSKTCLEIFIWHVNHKYI